MNRQELISLIRQRHSFLCVGLDADPAKMPSHLQGQPDAVYQFNKAVIDATIDYAVAYKPNIAFYESMGVEGLIQLRKTMQYLHGLDKKAFTIADAKRGDIGNTSQHYAKAFLDPQGEYNFDAITVAPYMGEDSVLPFMSRPDKWVILLALTSNKGASDFQFLRDTTGKALFEHVLERAVQWGTPDNLMFVVGATKASMLSRVRAIAPHSFLLVPGVGAQGGSLDEVCRYGLTADCGLLVNSSRGIIYASNGPDFAERAADEARKLQIQMAQYI
ncbi:MAG: orotidine-5'-phosphate decarboxylase [bacterium P3]|nr:MAG: orotidine-5'-phosphate decarboxylase [bacterium P3]KWW40996.1 MAG: orotidine-5'-phosphate decarboxylase [bacterium F083]